MKIRVVIAKPGEAPVVAEIDNGLRAMQEVVGGLVELVQVGDLDVWVNEEGLLLELPFNREIAGIPMVGPILVAASTKSGKTRGLTDAQVARAFSMLAATQYEYLA